MMDTVNLLAEIEVLKRRLENAVEVVRCNECRWSVEDDYKMKCWNIKGLNKTDGVVNPDDFCSYGERREP